MIRPEIVNVSDCTLPEAEDHFELSFKEKIELCRLIDKLGVSSIDLCPIRRKKIDRLLVKSICSAVKNASVAVPVSLTDEESIQVTWEALREAFKDWIFRDPERRSVRLKKPYLLAAALRKTLSLSHRMQPEAIPLSL